MVVVVVVLGGLLVLGAAARALERNNEKMKKRERMMMMVRIDEREMRNFMMWINFHMLSLRIWLPCCESLIFGFDILNESLKSYTMIPSMYFMYKMYTFTCRSMIYALWHARRATQAAW